MITTERLLLRRHRLGDLDAAAALLGDPATMRFIGGATLSREDVWKRLLRYHGHWELLGFGLWAIEERATGRFVGEAGFADFHRGLGDTFDPFPEAGWIFAADVHGRGYAGEAMTAALGWLGSAGRAARSVCIIDPGNAASLRLAARLGYRPTGERPYRGVPVILHERIAPGHPAMPG